MSVAFKELARRVEILYGLRRQPSMKDIYELALDILVAEKRLEDSLERTKSDEERKQIEKELKRVKELRDRVVAIYVARRLGLPSARWSPW